MKNKIYKKRKKFFGYNLQNFRLYYVQNKI